MNPDSIIKPKYGTVARMYDEGCVGPCLRRTDVYMILQKKNIPVRLAVRVTCHQVSNFEDIGHHLWYLRNSTLCNCASICPS